MNQLGWLHQNGWGVPEDYVKAREWYEKAADKGDAGAMINLGSLYQNGQGVALGSLYQSGQGVAQDYVKAREWFEKAADKGDASQSKPTLFKQTAPRKNQVNHRK